MAGFTDDEKRIVLLACCLSGFVTPLITTMMNLSLVSIGEEFSVGSHELGYINSAFLLSSVAFMVPLSKLADIAGKKRMYTAGLVVILIACILACFSPSFWWVVGCRVLMGAGAAASTGMSITLITDVFGPEHRGGAIGAQTMCVYVGLAIGPPIGGALNDILGWHLIFVVVMPLAIAAIALMSTFKHEFRPCEGQDFDNKGAILYAIGMFLTFFGVINMPEAWAFVSLAAGIVFIAGFAMWQLRIPNYLMNMRLFKTRIFTGSCIAAFLNYAASYSVSYFLALYLQSIGALSAMEAGGLMLIQAAVQSLLTVCFGKISDNISDKRILPTAGMCVTAVGVSMFLLYGMEMNMPLVVATMVVVGAGIGMFSSPNTSVIMGSVRREETSEASATVSVMRQTGMTTSMGVAMAIITLVMGGADRLVEANYQAFLDAMHYSFAVCVAMCLIGVLASLLRGTEIKADFQAPNN